jgi:hypothetical protein
MNKIALLIFTLFVNACFAMKLTVTNIIPDLNLYVFDHRYVFKVSGEIPTFVKGSKLDIDMDLFYNTNEWVQQVEVIVRRKVGSSYESGVDSNKHWVEEIFAENNSDVEKTYHSKTKDHYVNERQIHTFTFTPIGEIEKRAMGLNDFVFFALNTAPNQPLKSFTSVFTDNGWFNGCPKDIIRENLSIANTGYMSTIDYLVDVYKGYPPGLTYEIYPIYDRNFPNYLAGVLSQCYKRKVFLYDTYNALAMFEYR